MEAGTKGLGAALAVGAAIAVIWGMIRYQIVYSTLRDNFPPQFKDNLIERSAFPVLVSANAAISANRLREGIDSGVHWLPFYFAIFLLLRASTSWLPLLVRVLYERVFGDQGLEGLPGKLQWARC